MKNSGHKKLEDQIDSLQKEIKKRTGCVSDFRTAISQTINRFKAISHDGKQRTAWKVDFAKKITRGYIRHLPLLHVKKSIPGRPAIPFEESTERIKRQRTQELRKSTPLPELVYATKMKLKASGQGAASKIIKDILSDPSKPSKYLKASQQSLETDTMMSREDAVALLVEADLSRHQYNILKSKSPKSSKSRKIFALLPPPSSDLDESSDEENSVFHCESYRVESDAESESSESVSLPPEVQKNIY
ncbi:unnamed protein product [Psylliodes chrysocephalus]|uniref:Uncharacterized protein n=1 Tax=Psylliodes chrysocephalus TaxID=3402493 RepID=A0A9P0DD95_9CUCU|nr:unnamed protein product [Psylliodes chrysocephala]